MCERSDAVLAARGIPKRIPSTSSHGHSYCRELFFMDCYLLITMLAFRLINKIIKSLFINKHFENVLGLKTHFVKMNRVLKR